MNCHAVAHGADLYEDIKREDIEQACCEYLADIYLEDWDPRE